MKAVVPVCVLLGACAVWGTAQKPAKTNGEEGRIIALESAWDQAEQNKDAAALANLLADNLVYVDYDGSISNKQQFLGSIKNACIFTHTDHSDELHVRGSHNVAVHID